MMGPEQMAGWIADRLAEDVALGIVCAGPGCDRNVAEAGRCMVRAESDPARYCSNACKQRAYRHRKALRQTGDAHVICRNAHDEEN